MSNARSQDFKLEGMILAFPNLVTPKKRENNGSVKLEFGGSLLWPKSVELTGRWESGETFKVSDEMVRTASAQWGEKAVGLIRDGLIKNPLLDGDGPQGVNKKTGERYKGFAGHRFIRVAAQEKYPPRLFDDKVGNDGKLVVITDAKRLYPGCRVHAVINVYTWEHAQNGKGLSFGLSMVQFAGDGERLASESGGGDPGKFFTGAAPTVSSGAGRAEGASSDAGGLFA